MKHIIIFRIPCSLDNPKYNYNNKDGQKRIRAPDGRNSIDGASIMYSLYLFVFGLKNPENAKTYKLPETPARSKILNHNKHMFTNLRLTHF